MSMTYADYLRLDTLLGLQHPGEHHEMLFIVVHQAYELWFKLLLHEFDRVKDDLTHGDLYDAIAAFQRCRTVMKLLVEQVDAVETLTPMSFGAFRERLDTASGFQSAQFRELEFVLGYKRPELLRFHPGNDRLVKRLNEPSVNDALHAYLRLLGVAIPERADVTAATEPSEAAQDGLLNLFRTRPDLVILFELMADFDEGVQEWRYRHIKLVERTIGAKPGTGGSLGVEFLKRSLFRPVFPDLWAIRHRL